MKIESITVIGGRNKLGVKEAVERVEFKMGNIVSIVGPTGCGKTTFINDIELYANCNTPSRRKVLINGEPQPEELVIDPSRNPVALISQHTNFLSDLLVKDFLKIHASVRQSTNNKKVVEETVEFANQLTGEPLNLDSAMTELSGGQTRSLLIADAVIIGNAPIILLDEIENAGIHRTKALDLLKKYNKIFIFVTHDPRIALFSDYRIVMKNGGMSKVFYRNEREDILAEKIKELDDYFVDVRNRLRDGLELDCLVDGVI